jgi:fructosamine-3-kinase
MRKPCTQSYFGKLNKASLLAMFEVEAYNHFAQLAQVVQLSAALAKNVPSHFHEYLHGDLWSGNAAADEQGQAIIYDPACYYGDREADIAMTELFGGYSYDFYVAYENVWPLDSGYKARKNLYNLYHILNHLNLFGSGYLHQAEAMMQTLIVQVK